MPLSAGTERRRGTRWLQVGGQLVAASWPRLPWAWGPAAAAAEAADGQEDQRLRPSRSTRSVPLQGASGVQGTATVNGASSRLQQAGGKVGKYKIVYKRARRLDAPERARRTRARRAERRKAVERQDTIGYIGEYNSGELEGLDPDPEQGRHRLRSARRTRTSASRRTSPGSEPGEPNKYYPTGKRTYARVVPQRHDPGRGAAPRSLKEDGCKSRTSWNDKAMYGAGLARKRESSRQDGRDHGRGQHGHRTRRRPTTARSAARSSPTASSSPADRVERGAVARRTSPQPAPNVKMLGPDGICRARSADPKKGAFRPTLAPQLELHRGDARPGEVPARRARSSSPLQEGVRTRTPDPYAIYGYESMALMLDAIKRPAPTGNDRQAVVDAIFETKNRQSVLGTYSIDKNGDTSLTDYGLYKIVNGKPVFSKVIKANTAG